MRSSVVALLFLAPLFSACALATTPLPIPPPDHVSAISVVYADGKTGNRTVTAPGEVQAICALLRSLNSDWLRHSASDANHQLSVYVRGGEEGAIGFWIGPDWMSASLPGDLVLAKRYRRLSPDERAALDAVLTPR